MISIAIVEDETSYAEQLKSFMEQFMAETGERIKLTFYRDGEDIIEDYKAQYDIILMDIQMRFMDGMTAAEKIRETDSQVLIMFITNMTNYAIRGYQVDALDYIVKPVVYFDFSQKMQRAIRRLPDKNVYRVKIGASSGIVRINAENIYYIESEGHILRFHTRLGTYEERGKMQEREAELVPQGFFRSNKSYLVNLNYVDGIKDGCCLICGEELLISRARKSEFMKMLAEKI
ncbi:MAG: LytTR family DNA-binding domain-containing protein [Lachnospiraceae bacterium]|nr:LytTR family DNA-binding domain-containing protein [Lachnospiraceae bacterium]